jgi:hypothetical protein
LKLHKVPTLEAININKPWSEWKERLRNFGVKPPKRGIELGWVTRGTRPKKPSSSRGFARGAWGAWGLKTENRTFFSSLFNPTTQKKLKLLLFFERLRGHSPSAQTHQPIREGGEGEGEGEGQGGKRVGPRPRGRVFFTICK